MLYKKISSFFHEESTNNRKDKKITKKEPETLEKILPVKCEGNLHRKITKKMLKLLWLNEEINNAKTLKLISLLP